MRLMAPLNLKSCKYHGFDQYLSPLSTSIWSLSSDRLMRLQYQYVICQYLCVGNRLQESNSSGCILRVCCDVIGVIDDVCVHRDLTDNELVRLTGGMVSGLANLKTL